MRLAACLKLSILSKKICIFWANRLEGEINFRKNLAHREREIETLHWT